jgi:hypothetical protein
LHNLIDPASINANFNRQPILTQVQRLEKFFQQDFSGMNGGQFSLAHLSPSTVIIRDLNVIRMIISPNETDAPLIINPNAPLTGAITI